MPPHPHPISSLFVERFGRPPTVVARAPGRVNLIGEHTDYNDGFVLPMALERCTRVAAAPRDDGMLNVIAADIGRAARWPIEHWKADEQPHWTSYIAGVASLLRRRGAALSGADLLISSDVPLGGGLSSSAALEVATALALAKVADAQFSPVEIADLARAAEHEFAGVPCGIMDQYVSALAQLDCAFLLDCRSREWQHIPLRLDGHVVLIVNSGVRHKLAAGEYAIRQRQCHEALEFFRGLDPAVRALRDVRPEVVQAHAEQMDAKTAARARHVTAEIQRTIAAADALRRGDLPELGRLMLESHQSLRDDYEVSCVELDLLVEIVSAVPGVLGARMTGGGFGGCIVAIARAESSAPAGTAIRERYDSTGSGPATLLVSRPGPGATLETP